MSWWSLSWCLYKANYRDIVAWLWFPKRSWLWWLIALPILPFTAHFVVWYQIRYGDAWAVFPYCRTL